MNNLCELTIGQQGQLYTTVNTNFDPSKTIEIGGVEHIYLSKKGLDVKFEILLDDLKKFDYLIINGIKFKRCDV